MNHLISLWSLRSRSRITDRHLVGCQFHGHLLPSYPTLARLDHSFRGRAHATLDTQIALVATLLHIS
jgi:hypothetical protein